MPKLTFSLDFEGMACLDMEQWRPNCDQNFGDQAQYIDMSEDDVRQSHPQWDEDTIHKVVSEISNSMKE